mgnify:CR=1 FL=1
MWKRSDNLDECVRQDRFHGRVGGAGRGCNAPGCVEAGEFRAPGLRTSSFDGPGDYRWFCLEHIRQFNAGYDWFEGMSPEEIMRAQSPIHGWERETRAFSPTAGIDAAPSLDRIKALKARNLVPLAHPNRLIVLASALDDRRQTRAVAIRVDDAPAFDRALAEAMKQLGLTLPA